MWAEAAKWIATFQEGVITALDADGYPVSVRQTQLAYDAQSGTMPVVLPAALGAVAGPANLLCHVHDDDLWSFRAIQVSGRLESHAGGLRFVSTKFEPPVPPLRQLMRMSRSMKAYLARRNLPVPRVDFASVKRMQANAQRLRDAKR